jgi:predicted lipoprotein with Yx(FWY)xxD motif
MAREPARRALPTDAAVARLTVGNWLAGHVWVPTLGVFALAGIIAVLLVVSLSASSTNSPRASVSVGHSDLGKLLVDGRGLTLYLYTHDKNSTSACTEVCARVWPPATISGRPKGAPGVATAKLKTVKRADNTIQLVYNGHPLYTFSGDTRGGQLGGEAFLGVWYVVSPSGEQITKPGSASTPPAY